MQLTPEKQDLKPQIEHPGRWPNKLKHEDNPSNPDQSLKPSAWSPSPKESHNPRTKLEPSRTSSEAWSTPGEKPSPLDGGLISRAPKGDGGQSSLLSHSIDLFGGGAMVERLRTLWSST